jgi:hemolysin activation/secretion protein
MFKTTLFALGVASAALSTAAFATEKLDPKSSCLALPDINKAEQCLHAAGNTFAKISADQQGVRSVVDQPASIRGEYAEYLHGDINNLQSPLLLKALQNDGKGLKVKVGAVDPVTHTYDVSLTTKPFDDKPYQGAVLVSNLGPDFSGREIASWYNRERLGNGFVLTSSLTKGFANIRSESSGGKYESAYFGLERATVYGLLEAQYLHSENETGGISKIYDLGGTTNRYSVAFTHWLSNDFSLRHQLSYTDRDQDFGAYGISETQHYTTYRPTLSYQHGNFNSSLILTKGLGGERDYDLIPLMGTFNPYFWSSQLDGSYRTDIGAGLVLNTRGSLFKGSQDMPSSERFGLGGRGAGSSHESGLFAGYKGYSYEFELNRVLANLNGLVIAGETGLNGSGVTSSTGEDLAVDAFKAGLNFGYQTVSLETFWSKSLATRNLDDDSRFSAEVIWRY